jgi:hypothetical protein
MSTDNFYDFPLNGKQEIDFVIILAESLFQSMFRTGGIKVDPDLLSATKIEQLESHLKEFLGVNHIKLISSSNSLISVAISRQLKDPQSFLKKSKNLVRTEIVKHVEGVLTLLEELKFYSEIENDPEGYPKSEPPPPPPPPPMMTSQPIRRKVESLLPSSPRLPTALKGDPKQQLHDELMKGKIRLRAVSIQRTPSGTPKPTDKVAQVVTFQDIAMEALRKKFRLQQEE